MDALSKADQKLLNRLRIPQVQKLLLENYWRIKPEEKGGWSRLGVFFKVIRPAMIGVLALPYFMGGTKPFVNIALVVAWLLYPIVVVIHATIAFGVLVCVMGNKDEAMDREFVKFLPGADSPLKQAYWIFLWIAMFGLTASEGCFFTSGMVGLCWIANWILNKVCVNSVKTFLAARTRGVMSDGKIIAATATRIK